MANSKGETSGKALEWDGNHLLVSRGGPMTYRVATAEDVSAALLANPEARMAVLAGAEARLPHLEEAAELLRKLVRGGHCRIWQEYGDWYDRDQALSTPTAESGKDSKLAHVCSEDDESKFCPACDGEYDAEMAEPAPVAEAPERVTHDQARNSVPSVNLWNNHPAIRRLLVYIHQQEQLEREVVELRKGLASAKALAKEWEELRNNVYRSYREATDQRDSLRAKLSESERKLEAAEERLTAAHDRIRVLGQVIDLQDTPETTGGEPAKAEPYEPHPAQAADRGAEHYGAREFDSPAAEAEPRFRVGQRVRVTGCKESNIPAARVGHLATVSYLQDRTAKGCVVKMEEAIGPYSPGEQWWVDFCELEPADTAPPRPGGDRPVMMSQLAKALRQVEEANPSRWFDALPDRLEREGTEKP